MHSRISKHKLSEKKKAGPRDHVLHNCIDLKCLEKGKGKSKWIEGLAAAWGLNRDKDQMQMDESWFRADMS